MAHLGPILASILIVGGGLVAARDYFVVWPARADTQGAFEGDLLGSLELLNQVPPGAVVLTTSDTYENAPIPLSFVPAAHARARAFDWNDFVIPADDSDPVYYVLARSREPAGSLPVSGQVELLATHRNAWGRPDGDLFRVTPPFSAPEPTRAGHALIGGAIEITGADFPRRVRPGKLTMFALHWMVRRPLPPGHWQFLAHVVDHDGFRLLSEDYNGGFPPSQWRAGDRVISWFNATVPADTPETIVDVGVSVFNRDTLQRLPVTDLAGHPGGDTVTFGPLRVDRPAPVAPPAHPLLVHFGPAMILTGYDLDRVSDDELSLRLHWQASGPADQDYTVFVHALNAQGKTVANADGQPGEGLLPTSTWGPGETFLDEHRILVPPGFVPARLEVGVYLLATGQRLPATDANGIAHGDTLTIAP